MGWGARAALAATFATAPALGPWANARAQTAAAPEAAVPVTAVGAGGVSALDSPRSASLSWVRLDGAGACATAPEIAEGIARILHRDALVSPTRAAMAIEARVEKIRGKKRFRAVIDVAVSDGKVKGTRTLESPGDDCRKLDEPAALAIALMIDPDALQAVAAPPPPPMPILVVKRDVLIVTVPILVPHQPPPPPPQSWSSSPELSLAAGPSLALGLVPGPASGIRFGVEVGPPETLGDDGVLTVAPSSIRLGVAAYSGSVEAVGDTADQQATLSMVAILPQLALCPTTVWLGARASFAACVAVDVGAITWTGDGFDTSVSEGVRPFVAVGPVAQARLVLAQPFAVELRGAAVVPLVRDQFVYELASGTNAVAYTPGAVGATFDAALVIGIGL